MTEQERIEKGHALWEGLTKQWKAEREPGQLQLSGGKMYKVLLPEGEPIFVSIKSGVDDYYGSTSSVPGQG